MNTHALEAKINAVEHIGSVAQALGSNFFEYVEPVAQLVASELMHDKYSSSVRKNATKLCQTLIECCPSHEQQLKLLHLFLPKIAAEISKQVQQTNFRNVKWLTKELQRCLRAVSQIRGQNFFSGEETAQLLDLCVLVLT